MSKPVFEVDKEGLAKLLDKRGKQFVVFELLSNAWDESSVTKVNVTLTPLPNSPFANIVVADDAPEGFHDLTHAYTLFAESTKKKDAEQRGRFNLGEKLVIALCREAKIITTKGSVAFNDKGRIESRAVSQTQGSTFSGTFRCTRAEYEQVCAEINRLLPPAGIETTFNGKPLPYRDPAKTFRVTLPTEIADSEGYLRATRRQTVVEVQRAISAGWLYELGVPVVEVGGAFNVNVMQKVPLNSDRDNVTPAYLKEIRAYVVNNTFDLLTDDDASEKWVDDAIEHKDISSDAVEGILTKRYGEKRVVYDPSDPEGSKLAMSKGYTVIPGRAFSRSGWSNIKRSGAALPAGQVTPSPKPYSDDPNAPVREEYKGEITEGMQRIIDWTKQMGHALLDADINVILIADRRVPASATFGGRQIEYNVSFLGRKWFDQLPTSEEVMSLIIHEFGHYYSGDHLSSQYHKALCKLGARYGTWCAGLNESGYDEHFVA
jgi:hypothetical protein